MILKTLGGLKLEGSNFQRPKALLVLAYLALEGQKERRYLAELFWPNQDNALGNLAMTLSRLKSVIPKELAVDDGFVRASLAIDTDDFQQTVARKDWDKALSLYQGSFLEGIDTSRNGVEAEEWIYEKRERFAELARQALLGSAEEKAKLQQFSLAAQEASKAYYLGHAPEPNVEDLKRLYLLLQAAQHLDGRGVQKEASGYGLNLDSTPQEARALLTAPTHPFSKDLLPSFVTRFIGRKDELSQMINKLTMSDVRLLSLLAQGGMGKTRLAVKVAKTLEATFYDGVCFASFVTTISSEQIPFQLAAALNYSFFGSGSAEEQILKFLKDKEMLLVLDNLEHLLDGVSFISNILLAAPKIKILATSRESLNLQAEHVIELKGLNFVAQDHEPSDAAKLFIQVAEHRQPEFLNAETRMDIDRLCELVEGMPLALELAASWLRTLGLKSIIAELEKGIDLLQSAARDMPQRHKSMKVVFDYSWGLLSLEEQAVMKRLTVFQGGFSLNAAKDIAGATLVVLSSLIDKSFLSMSKDERYRRQPLVRQYVREKLEKDPAQREAIEKKHGGYFLAEIRKYATKLHTLGRKAILDKLEPDLANIKAAWLWAVKTNNVDELGDSVEVLSEILSNNHREAVELIDQAIARLDESNPHHHLCLSKLYLQQVKHLMWLNISTDHAIAKGFELAKRANYRRGIVRGTLFTTDIFDSGKLADVRVSPFEEGFKSARRYGTAVEIADYYCCELQYQRLYRTLEEVGQYFAKASAELRQQQDYVMLAEIQMIYGAFLVYQQHFEEGEKILLESLSFNHHLDKKVLYSVLYVELGYLNFKLKNFEEAIHYLKDAVDTATQIGWIPNQTKALGYLLRIAIAQNDQTKANDYLRQVDFNIQLNYLLEALIAYAEYQIHFGDLEKGIAILQLIQENIYTESRDRDQVKELLDHLQGKFPKPIFQKAQKQAKHLSIEKILEQVKHTNL